MWRTSGDSSTDFSFYTKRVILSGVYVSTLMFWLNDETDNYETKVKFSDGSSTSSPILIISDGRESRFAKRLEKRVFKKNYHQAAIVGNLAHHNDHKCTAHQLFLPGGPLAILPLAGKRSTFVWSLPQERGNILNGLKNLSFLNHLKDQIGDTLINLSLIQEKKLALLI